ncbi:MAG: KEOPS complex kinase/ATPase Bud32 [Candidatus Aenigmatarchaeota archaeon]
MQVLKQGAEAILYLDEFEGTRVLVKERIKKDYRIEQIDIKLRKERTKEEVKLLTEARRVGIPTPKIFEVDYEKFKIIMEFIEGERVKEFFSRANKETIEKICFEMGRLVGKLHSAGIIHGDLTTSNMILKENQIYFIDFGLGFFSKKIEDQGVDLNLLFESLRATHYDILNICWENIVKGYKQEYRYAEEVLKKVDEIESRARYAKRKAKGQRQV